MGEQDIGALQSATHAISEQLASIRHENAQQRSTMLEKLGEQFRMIAEKLTEGFSEVQENQSTLALVSRAAEMKVLESMIGQEKRGIDRKVESLRKDIEQLDKRYEKLANELTDNTHELVRDLDGHVIELEGKYFRSAGEAYSSRALPGIETGFIYYPECSNARSERVERGAFEAAQRIREFGEKRSGFLKSVRRFIRPLPTGSRQGIIPIPFYSTERSEHVKIYTPGRIGAESESISYEPDPALVSLAEPLAGMKSSMEANPIDESLRASVITAAESFFESGLLKDTALVSRRKELLNCLASAEIKVDLGTKVEGND